MIFFDHGHAYNTQDMLTFRTGDKQVPFIFMTQDHAEVFLFLKDSDGVMHPSKATDVDIEQAAVAFGISEILPVRRSGSDQQLHG
jgi:hypothetical protein